MISNTYDHLKLHCMESSHYNVYGCQLGHNTEAKRSFHFRITVQRLLQKFSLLIYLSTEFNV